MIPQKNISKISNKTFRAGKRRIPESVIERDYCISWFLFGLAQSALKDKLVFKGGTALRRCYFKDYRFSEDLDFTLIEKITLEKILIEFKKIFTWVQEESGITFSHSRQDPPSENTYTFYISYIGPLPGKEKDIKVDITYREKLLKPIEEKSIIKTYEEYDDFVDTPTIKVYSLCETAIEKTCALFSPSRNEPRDLYDIYYLIENERVEFFVSDIEEKMAFKDISFQKNQNEFSNKEKKLKKLWEKRLSQQMSSLPDYENIYRTVKRAFRQANILSKN